MTISSTTRKAGPFTGNGATVAFPFSFKVFADTDVVVVRTDLGGFEATLVLTTDYTVALNADQDTSPGGTVTCITAPATGFMLTLTSSVPQLQQVDLTNTGGFYPSLLNAAFDRLTIFVQELTETVSRSLKFGISTPSGTDSTLPAPVPYALIGWNAAGDGFQNADPTYSTALATDLSASGGSALIGDNDGAGGTLWTTIRGFIAYLAASAGSAIVGFIQAGTGAVLRTVQSKLRDTVSVKDFGAVGDGVANDTAAIQAAIDYCLPAGLQLRIPAGVYIIGAPGLLVSNTGVGSTGGTPSVAYKMGIVGDGMASTILKYVGPDLAPCLKVITGGASRSEYSGFTLLQNGATKFGYGLELVQSSNIEFENVGCEGFMFGVRAEDNFSIFWNNCRFASNTVGVEAIFNFVSRPNDFSFNNCNFVDNEMQGARFQNPTTLSFNGGSFEGNGGPVAEYGGLRINGNPVDGISGISVSGVYFEGNKGSFDIGIYDSNNPGIHNIRGCTFNRVTNTAYVTTNIAFYKAYSAKTIISIHGNGFAGFNSYVADAGRAYIQAPAPVDANYVLDLGPNIWGDAVEKPVLPGARAADSNVVAAVRFNGTTGAIDGSSVNVTSVTRNAVGDYTVTYTKPLRIAKNACSIGVAEATMWPELFSETVSSMRFKTKNAAASYADFSNISLLVYGSDGAI